MSIIFANLLQALFEGSLLYAMETTFKPTNLDKMQDPETYSHLNEQGNPDQKKELDCNRVMRKCWGELLFIGCYLVVVFGFVMGLIYQLQFGKPLTVLVEISLAYGFDQLKSILF